MKISQETVSFLKYLSTVNPSIIIEEGNELYSKSEANTIVAYAKVRDDFPGKFVTTDLPRFLNTLGLYDDEPLIEFKEDCLMISSSDGSTKTHYFQSNETLVHQPNKLPRPLDNPVLSFHISKENLNKIFKASGVMGYLDISIKAQEGKIYIVVLNKKESSSSSNTFSVEVAECDPSISCEFFFKKMNLKLPLEYSYDVKIVSQGLSEFTAVDSPFEEMKVYIVTEITE